ncbi:DUF6089 family protein [Flavobacterium sp.]|uniref:type IX secretion system protein PorG n=1 Tax=Flavobacterium sp. TaxID=239 RepID=UPI0038FD246D
MYKIFNLLFLFSIFAVNAQIHELGVFGGGSNFVGDVGLTDYLYPNKPAFGILYKWNKSPRHSYRFSYTQTNLKANDLVSKEISRYQRGYNFDNSIKEVSLGLEFNFFDFDLHKSERKITPYLFSGISYFKYDEMYVLLDETQIDKSKNSFSIPLNLGIKSNITPYFILGIEVAARFTFTDNIDGSNPENEDYKTLRFGNLNNKDVYLFSGLTLTYTFGETPCYCKE